MGRLFGTDGVRGVANEELTPDLANALAKAAGDIFIKGKQGKVVIGRDPRVSGELLEAAMVSGFLSMGIDVILLGVTPTPAVAYITRKIKADMGVMVSASHNPYEYNGIKFFNQDGYKLRDEVEDQIEEFVLKGKKPSYQPTGKSVGKIIKEDYKQLYQNFVKGSIGVDFKGMKVALDVANGSAYEVAPKVFSSLGAEVFVINNTPDGFNINDGCGSTHPEGLKETIINNQCDFGFSFDGDADRLIALDEKGQVVDGDQIMAICGSFLKEEGKLKKDMVVATVMSNIGLGLALENKGIQLKQTKVGDRYVLEEMKRYGYSLGGEQSGHLIFLDYNTTGDGLLSALKLGEIVKRKRCMLSALAGMMEKFPQILVNAKVPNEHKHTLLERPIIKKEVERLSTLFNKEGRVLVRPSGTEPLVRVMIEGKNAEEIAVQAFKLAKLIEEQF